jgi:hypothetical protein
METNIKLDDRLLNEAKQLSHIDSTEEVIQKSLERYGRYITELPAIVGYAGKIRVLG